MNEASDRTLKSETKKEMNKRFKKKTGTFLRNNKLPPLPDKKKE